MSDKVKPWHNRKPKHHGEFRGKKPHTRPSQDKRIILPRENGKDRFGPREQYDRNDYLDE